jgi:hypothetical protein
MMNPKVVRMAQELMKKQNLPEEMKKPGENGPSLESWIREIPPKPKE